MEDYVSQLNQNNPGVSYSLNGNTIAGTWSQTASASGILGNDKMHLDYSIVVTLHPDKTYTYIENMNSSTSSAGLGTNTIGPSVGQFNVDGSADDDGIKLFSSSQETFRGKTFGQKQMGFALTFGGKKGQDRYSYNFDAEKIKQPLLKSVEAAGYKPQKKSFFKSLLGK